MKISLILSGTELLNGDQRDGLLPLVTGALSLIGERLEEVAIVSDEREQLSESIDRLFTRADLCILSGGLGVTEDDLTRDVLATQFQRPLIIDQAILESLSVSFPQLPHSARERFASRPEHAVALENVVGVAPGLLLQRGEKRLFALPGVPSEFQALLSRWVIPAVESTQDLSPRRQKVEVIGLGEARLQQILNRMPTPEGIERSIQAHENGRLWLKLAGRESFADLLESHLSELLDPLQDFVLCRAGRSLPQFLLSLLGESGLTFACAESCTGGQLAASLTAEAGASRSFLGGVVAYHNTVKMKSLGVREETLIAHGAVSEACALEMARGARLTLGSDWAASTTGVAGPGGGSAEKPVGLVCFAIAGPHGVEKSWRVRFRGDRRRVQARSVTEALAEAARLIQASISTG